MHAPAAEFSQGMTDVLAPVLLALPDEAEVCRHRVFRACGKQAAHHAGAMLCHTVLLFTGLLQLVQSDVIAISR